MKNEKIFTATAALLLSSSICMGSSTLSFRDYIEKEDIYSIIAESDKETAMIANSSFWPKKKLTTLIGYCEDIGGVAQYDKENYFGKSNPIKCLAPNGESFSAITQRLQQGSNNYVVVIKHDKVQPLGHALKKYIEENKIDKKTNIKDFNSAMLDFGTNYYNYHAYCKVKGGKYIISNSETNNKAVEADEYLLKGLMEFKSPSAEGTHWCIDTRSVNDEFTVKVSPEPFNHVLRFQPTYTVDRTAIVKYSDPLPWYSCKAVSVNQYNFSEGTNNLSSGAQMSKQPSQTQVALAEKSLRARNTALGRVNGAIEEAVYLGSNNKGCELSAVMGTIDKPVDQKYAYGKSNKPEWIMNFKKCSNGAVEYIGESFERGFSSAVEPEYERVLGVCRVKGVGMSSYLGYDVNCERQGADRDTYYEMTIIKKDKLIARIYEK